MWASARRKRRVDLDAVTRARYALIISMWPPGEVAVVRCRGTAGVAAALVVMLAAVGSYLAVSQGGSQEPPWPSTATGARWNDPTLFAAPEGPAAAYANEFPLPTAQDSARIVWQPPDDVKAACVQFIHSALASAYVPADISQYLIALEASPTFGGKDVFLTWYTTQGLLIHIVDTANNVTVRVLDTSPQEPVPEQERAQWVMTQASRILAPDMQPHPLTPPRESVNPWGLGERQRLGWSTLVAPLHAYPGQPGLLLSRLGDLSGPVLDSLSANSDGRCLRFVLVKTFPQCGLPPWTGRFHPAPPPEPRAARPPPPEPERKIQLRSELTPEELAKERN
jgi:hypothetical protein